MHSLSVTEEVKMSKLMKNLFGDQDLGSLSEEWIVALINSFLIPGEALVIRSFYGIAADKKTLGEIAKEQDVGFHRISQMKRRGLRKLASHVDMELLQMLQGFQERPEKILCYVLDTWKRVGNLERECERLYEAVAKPQSQFGRPIEDLELTLKCYNFLKGVAPTILDLVRISEEELLNMKGFGNKMLQEVKDVLSVRGLHLGMRV